MGKACAFTGHRPSKLPGGYDWFAKENLELARKIRDVVVDLIENEDVDTFIAGGAIGVDQISFSICQKLKETKYPYLKLILAMPFENQDRKWFKQADKDRLAKQRRQADELVLVDTVEEYEYPRVKVGDYHPAKMQLRNQYMVDNVEYLIAVWDGTKGGTANCVRWAKKKGMEQIIRICPKTLGVER